MEYPEEIYVSRATANGRYHGIPNALSERSYRLGYEAGKTKQADPLEGYSNLTAAIIAGEPIDWKKLDKLKVQCVNTSEGSLRGVLTRNESLKPDLPDAWWGGTATAAYINALNDGWHGQDGWTLWVEGEIPLIRKTADQLDVGTYFLGEIREKRIAKVYVGETLGSKVVLYTPRMGKSEFPASEWVVLEEHGPFIKPESN